jgi:SAM-dependent methyltransferase
MKARMSGWLPHGFDTREAWRTHVLERGCHDARENERIFEKWFARAPKVVFRRAASRFGLRDKTLCDVGCCYGANLFFARPGSYGLEVNADYVRFARGLGLTVHERDVVEDDLTDLPRVDAVWCGSVIEHVDSPHILLRKLHLLLKPGGLLMLFAPVVPPVAALRRLPKYGSNFTSHLHDDHVSAFVPKTLRFTCERAGFETVELTALYRAPFSLLDRVLFLPATCMYVGRARDGWDYPANSVRRAAPNAKGFVSRRAQTTTAADGDS